MQRSLAASVSVFRVRLHALGSAAFLAAGLGQAASAQNYETLFKTCFASTLPDRVIASCSAVIGRRLAEGEDLATAFKNRGNAHDDMGEHAQALDDYGQALAINPQDADAFNSRGTTYMALGQHDRAVGDFDQAIALNPASPMASGNRCYARALLGQLETALADCDTALRLKPGNPAARAARAFVHLRARRPDAAITDYDAVLRARSDDAPALFGRGLARALKGDRAGADIDLAAARARQPDIEDEMARLGLRLQDFR